MNTLTSLMAAPSQLENNPLFTTYMTTKELAEALGVTPRTIQQTVESMGEDFTKSISQSSTGGRPTMIFNQAQATAIKLELKNHSKVNELSPKTELEKALIVEQALQYLLEKKTELMAQLEESAKTIREQGTFIDTVTASADLLDMKQTADTLNLPGLGRNNLITELKKRQILTPSGAPYRQYIEAGYFCVKEVPYSRDGKTYIYSKTYATQKGLYWLTKILKGVSHGRSIDG